MKCPNCESELSPHRVTCSVCLENVGFPNVRAAETREEQDALKLRYDDARTKARDRNAERDLEDFEQAIDAGQAVMAKGWATIVRVMEDKGDLFKTFYRQVQDEDRSPLDNGFDQQRQAVDAMLFPHYLGEIRFAALSLTGRGPESYGNCHLTFRTRTISNRSSLFEENTLVFADRHNVPATKGPPPGFKGRWNDRGRLAVAKLGAAVDDSTEPEDYPDILLKQTGATDTDDFIEVHIYGKLDEHCVESYRLPKPKNKDEQVFHRRLKRKLEEAGATERKD